MAGKSRTTVDHHTVCERFKQCDLNQGQVTIDLGFLLTALLCFATIGMAVCAMALNQQTNELKDNFARLQIQLDEQRGQIATLKSLTRKSPQQEPTDRRDR